ncbi:uncharacterized protein L201_000934 [Kwoniella dendrophila CBS 6074]|uniref:Mediator of RNA polymerase II transcription subunit 7 n=1 Tax=Kwoniella dendrophila CBS 6074 TaxID=1295534 RepID=A0AAX4JMH4_9TREE
MSSQPFKTDSLLPTSLPSATLGSKRRNFGQGNSSRFPEDDQNENLNAEERSQRLLDKEHERWNERIDKEIKGVLDGLKDLIELADIGTSPSPLISSTLPLHLPLRISSLIRSSQNIRDLSHELKLLLVLGDEQNIVEKRDKEMDLIRNDIVKRRLEVGNELKGLLGLSKDENEVDKAVKDSKSNIADDRTNENQLIAQEETSHTVTNPNSETQQIQTTKENTNEVQEVNPAVTQSPSQPQIQPQTTASIAVTAEHPQIDTQGDTLQTGQNVVSPGIPTTTESTIPQHQQQASTDTMDIDKKDDEEDEDDFEEV